MLVEGGGWIRGQNKTICPTISCTRLGHVTLNWKLIRTFSFECILEAGQ